MISFKHEPIDQLWRILMFKEQSLAIAAMKEALKNLVKDVGRKRAEV